MAPKRSSSSPSKPSKRYRSSIGAATAADDSARLIASHHLAEHAGGGQTYLSTRQDKVGLNSLKEVSLELAAQALYETIRFPDKPEGGVSQKKGWVGWNVNRETEPNNIDIGEISQFVQRLEEDTANRLLSVLLYLSYQALQAPNDPGVSVIAIASLFFHDRISRLSLSSLFPPTILLNKIPQCTALTDLNLSHSPTMRDNVLAKVLAQLPTLEVLNLKASTKIGDESIQAVSKAARGSLRVVNLSFTAVGVKGLSALIGRCASLEVLKLQAVGNLNEKAVNQIIGNATNSTGGGFHLPLSNLRTLKLRQTLVTDAALGRFLSLCSTTLLRLDVSYTELKSLDIISSALHTLPEWQLEKLVASGLPLTPLSLESFFRPLSERPYIERRRFKVLKLGSIPSVSTKAPGVTDVVMKKLLPSFEKLVGLEKLSLFGNVYLGKMREPLRSLIGTVGRRCKRLDLTALPVTMDHLEGLVPSLIDIDEGEPERDTSTTISNGEDQDDCQPSDPPRLELLVLDSTKIADGAEEVLKYCHRLKALHLAETKISPRFLSTLLKNCPDVSILNLTSCRGIPVTQRRTFFDCWEKGEVEVPE